MKPKAANETIIIPDAGRPEPLGRAMRLLSSIRWREVVVQQGTPLFGALFSIGNLSQGKAAALSCLLAASCALFAHVFVFNDWAGAKGDLRDPYRAASVFSNRGVRSHEIGYLSLALLALTLALLAPLGLHALAIGTGIVIISVTYSAPGLHFKGIPLVSSALHFAGGVLHFLLGYSLFGTMDARGLAIGAFFGLVNVAGHLTHEARDWEGDRLNGIRTNAVRFGRRSGFIASFLLFTMAYALLVVLAVRGAIPHRIVWIAAIYPFQLYWTVQTLRGGLTFESIGKMQARYRVLFMLIGAIVFVALLPSIEP